MCTVLVTTVFLESVSNRVHDSNARDARYRSDWWREFQGRNRRIRDDHDRKDFSCPDNFEWPDHAFSGSNASAAPNDAPKVSR